MNNQEKDGLEEINRISTCSIGILPVKQHVNDNIRINEIMLHYSNRVANSFL